MHPLLTTDPDEAVRVLQAGGLVALPTETVYGLAACAHSAAAVGRIYQVKGRPLDHPVIVHLADADQIDQWARDVPRWVLPLIDRCWPGPLTLVMARADQVGDYLTGGQETVGLRVPGHQGTRTILRRLDAAVAAPSANRYGHVSPTAAQHVIDELGDFLDPARDRVFDGGVCDVGVESTIIDVTGDQPRLLRPGAVATTTIEGLTGRPVVAARENHVRAPGMLAAHYAPRARVVLASPQEVSQVVEQVLHEYPDGLIGAVALSAVTWPPDERLRVIGSYPTDIEFAHELYGALRAADEQQMTAIVFVPPPDEGVGLAVRDRLQRAATGRSDPTS